MTSLSPKNKTKQKDKIDIIIAINRINFSLYRLAKIAQNGDATAADKKKMTKRTPVYSVAINTESTKKRNKLEVTANGAAPRKDTIIRLFKIGSLKTL
jgi:hypothetical protein